MLAKRIIPCLDVDKGRVVKGVKFISLRDAGDPVEAAKAYNDAGADELVFLDITASVEQRSIMIDVVSKTAEVAFMPLTVGGGIRSVTDVRTMLNAGADKVSVNTAAVEHPELVREASERFGNQCIVVAIDAKRRQTPDTRHPRPASLTLSRGGQTSDTKTNRWEVYIHGGRTLTGKDAVEWATQAEALGAGEILLTSMDRDGTQDGYDLELTKAVAQAVGIPVVASGGAGKLEHFARVLTEGRADAALAASLFHFGQLTIGQVKTSLAQQGILVRG